MVNDNHGPCGHIRQNGERLLTLSLAPWQDLDDDGLYPHGVKGLILPFVRPVDVGAIDFGHADSTLAAR